jgi:hypothetical protein
VLSSEYSAKAGVKNIPSSNPRCGLPGDEVFIRKGRFPEETKDLPLALGEALQSFDILWVHAGHVNFIPRIQDRPGL